MRFSFELKDKIRKGRLTIGSWLTIGHAAVAEIMAKAGFDWLTVDLEHSSITLAQAQDLVQVIESCGVTPLVRVGENRPSLIKRVMDVGASGVIVPMVNRKEDAITAVNAVKYPPVGTRGVGLARAQGYGMEFGKYKEWINEGSIVIVQIEHHEAIKNLDSILSVEGIDGFIVGPYDLSSSYGRPGEFDHPTMVEALKQVERVAGNYKTVAGYHVVPPNAELVIRKIQEGYRFIAFGVDMMFLGEMCRGGLETIKQALTGLGE